MNRAPQHVIRKLERCLECAKFEGASFGFTHEMVSVNGREAGTVDAFVKETTRVYRQTWHIPELEELLAWAKGEKSCSQS